MFALLILLSLLSSSSSAPVTTSDDHIPLNLFGRALPACMNVARYRTKQDIVLSCVATIFACTWVAVHPNTPGPGDSGWTRFKRKATTMVYAMIAPEFMTGWAMVQWLAARKIVRGFNGTREIEVPWYWLVPCCIKQFSTEVYGAVKEWFEDPRNRPNDWTLTHGFFIQMGGFILYDGEIPKRALTFNDLKKMIDKNQVVRPSISEHEINDKSKGDFLTKLIVVLQTSWFVFQCVARWVSGLPVTELEVVTLAFAALNIITYGLWWKKPQNVLCAVRVQLSPTGKELEDSITEYPTERSRDDKVKSWFTRKLEKEMSANWIKRLYKIPFRLIQAPLRPLGKMWGGRHFAKEHDTLRVPMFYAEAGGEDSDEPPLPFLLISMLFGGLHLIPWFYKFPSTTELWLWRSSALLITTEPLLFFLTFYQLPRALFFILAIPCAMGFPLYVLARLLLLGLSFTTLRTLPPGSDLAIEWTTFLPHI